MDISRTNLIEMDILTEGPPVASKRNTVPLIYREFLDYERKQLEEAGIISRRMGDWGKSNTCHAKERGMNREFQQPRHSCKY